MATGLNAPPDERMVHLCIDMQRIFTSDGLWPAPWIDRVLPVVEEIARHRPEKTIFTRFMTPYRAHDMPGTWRRYYDKWREATRTRLDPGMLDLMPSLQTLVPPATEIEKTRYSAFAESSLLARLRDQAVEGLIVTGSETDVCVLATVLDAVDCGFRVIVVRDGICSSSDEGHEALLALYHRRYSLQIETADAEEILRLW